MTSIGGAKHHLAHEIFNFTPTYLRENNADIVLIDDPEHVFPFRIWDSEKNRVIFEAR